MLLQLPWSSNRLGLLGALELNPCKKFGTATRLLTNATVLHGRHFGNESACALPTAVSSGTISCIHIIQCVLDWFCGESGVAGVQTGDDALGSRHVHSVLQTGARLLPSIQPTCLTVLQPFNEHSSYHMATVHSFCSTRSASVAVDGPLSAPCCRPMLMDDLPGFGMRGSLWGRLQVAPTHSVAAVPITPAQVSGGPITSPGQSNSQNVEDDTKRRCARRPTRMFRSASREGLLLTISLFE